MWPTNKWTTALGFTLYIRNYKLAHSVQLALSPSVPIPTNETSIIPKLSVQKAHERALKMHRHSLMVPFDKHGRAPQR